MLLDIKKEFRIRVHAILFNEGKRAQTKNKR